MFNLKKILPAILFPICASLHASSGEALLEIGAGETNPKRLATIGRHAPMFQSKITLDQHNEYFSGTCVPAGWAQSIFDLVDAKGLSITTNYDCIKEFLPEKDGIIALIHVYRPTKNKNESDIGKCQTTFSFSTASEEEQRQAIEVIGTESHVRHRFEFIFDPKDPTAPQYQRLKEADISHKDAPSYASSTTSAPRREDDLEDETVRLQRELDEMKLGILFITLMGNTDKSIPTTDGGRSAIRHKYSLKESDIIK
tara:strand:- start:858 stop:1622 length:765 start_codon:yes stop_codon:yes gene_type:complete